jgi:hypothetical protein
MNRLLLLLLTICRGTALAPSDAHAVIDASHSGPAVHPTVRALLSADEDHDGANGGSSSLDLDDEGADSLYDDDELSEDELESDDVLADELGDDDEGDDDDDDDGGGASDRGSDERAGEPAPRGQKAGLGEFHTRVDDLRGAPKQRFMLARKCLFAMCSADLEGCRKVESCSLQLMSCIGSCVSGKMMDCLGDCMSSEAGFFGVTECYDRACRELVLGTNKERVQFRRDPAPSSEADPAEAGKPQAQAQGRQGEEQPY